MCPGPLIGLKNLPQIRLIHNLVVFHNFGNQLRDAEERQLLITESLHGHFIGRIEYGR